MLTRPRLRSHAGCAPCKKRRKKCDEQKPICGACQRLDRSCSWTADNESDAGHALVKCSDPVSDFFIRRLRQGSPLSKSVDLSGFRDMICASHALGICFKSSNSSFDPLNPQRNGWSIQSTLTFAPVDKSLSWDCVFAHGLMFVGNRYQDYELLQAGMIKYSQLMTKIRAVVGNENKRCDYDALAAISNLAIFSAAKSWNKRFRHVQESLGIGHAVGMLAILETMQPQQFQDDRALAFFEHARYMMIMGAILSKRATCLTSESWKTVPWAQAKHFKDSMQILIDVLCETVDLQSELYILTPYSQNDCDLSGGRIQDKVKMLLRKLQNWHQAAEFKIRSCLKVKEQSARYNAMPTFGSSLIESEKAMSLCELGIFNMILIYLCRFLKTKSSFSRIEDTLPVDMKRNYSPEARLTSRMTPLKLPIEDSKRRARIAAREVVMIWGVIASNGLLGIATIHLGLPMFLARAVLIHEGDAACSDLDEALGLMPGFWSGAI